MENIMNNISELHRMRTINGAYKNTIIFLSVVIGIIVLLSIYISYHYIFI